MSTKSELEKLYVKKKLSTWELAKIYGVSQTQIRRWLTRFDIPRRSYKENKMPVQKGHSHNWGGKISKAMMGNTNSKKGENHHFWKGEAAGYTAKHNWARKYLGTPAYCEHCKQSDKKRYEWANVSGKYLREPTDWLRLCSSCHKKYDLGRAKK